MGAPKARGIDMTSIDLPGQIPPPIDSHLRIFARRVRRIVLFRALAVALLAAMFWVLVWSVIDRFIALPTWWRGGLLVLLIAMCVAILRRPVASILSRTIDLNAAALRWDNRDSHFRQALATVVSQSLSPPGQRASAQMLRQLGQEVELKLSAIDPASLAPIKPALHAWVGAIVGIGVMICLSLWSWLDLTTLLSRQFAPFRPTAPVTDVRISVERGSFNVDAGEPATINVTPSPPGSYNIIIRTSTDGLTWTAAGMTRLRDGSYTHTLAAMSRDTLYEVHAGDAVRGPYTIRVLRQPVVREFRIHLDYPDYVDRPPITVTRPDGVIEAPINSRARITIISSEPLQQLWFNVGNEKLPTQSTDNPNVRTLELTILQDVRYELDLLSDRSVHSPVGATLNIRAIPDLAPISTILLPRDVALVGPREKIRVPFLAKDDYALGSLELRVSVDNAVIGAMLIPLQSASNAIQDAVLFDVASWNVSLGQMVALTLVAKDKREQATQSPPFSMVITPQTIDPGQRRRVAQLRQASRLAASIVEELDTARRALDQAGDAQPAAMRSAIVALAGASDSANVLRRSILDLAVRVSGEDRVRGLFSLMDTTQMVASGLDRASAAAGTDEPNMVGKSVITLRELAQREAQTLNLLWQGAAADIVLAQRRNLAAVQLRAEPEINRLREEIESQIEQLGMEPRLSDLETPLQSRVEAAARVTGELEVVRYEDLARTWAQTNDPPSIFLGERLLAAAQVEAVRADANLAWARDLQIASRAARALDSVAKNQSRPTAELRQEFVAVLETLARSRQQRITTSPASDSGVDAARQLMFALGGQTQTAIAATMPSERGGAIANDSRDRTLSMIRKSQEMLAALPQLLASVEQAGHRILQTQGRLRVAIDQLRAANEAQQSVARRAVDSASELVEEAYIALVGTIETIDFDELARLGRELRLLTPETPSLAASFDGHLVPMLKGLHQAADNRDGEAIERGARESLAAAAAVRDALREARQAVLDRDPTVVARSFAQIAASQPTTEPDSRQPDSLSILRQGWDESLGRSIEQRLAGAISTDQFATEQSDGQPNFIRQEDADPPAFREPLEAYFQVLRGIRSDR